MATNDQYVVKPLDKALKLLEVVAASPVSLTLKQVAIDTGLPKTTAFKYVVTLKHRGLLAMEQESGRITLGSNAFLLASRGAKLHQMRERCLTTMTDLRDEFSETVNLAILEGPDVVYIGVVQSMLALRSFDREGRRDPAILTALGRSLIAAQDPDGWAAFTQGNVGKRTGVDAARMLGALHDAVAEGYAIDEGDNVNGLTCIGAAIRGEGGRPIASISVSGPASRIDKLKQNEIAAALQARAATLGTQLTAH